MAVPKTEVFNIKKTGDDTLYSIARTTCIAHEQEPCQVGSYQVYCYHMIDTTKLFEYFSKQPVELAYLFGSYASGKQKPYSDIDIAVLFSKECSQEEKFDLRKRMTSDISALLKTEQTDILDLDNASPFLQFEAIKNRKELFIRNNTKRVDTETRILQNYFDRQYYIKRHTKLGLQSLKEEYGITN